jgi:hypothetical protein
MNGQRSGKVRLVALLALSLFLLPMVTCTPVDSTPRTCAYWGGRFETYRMPGSETEAGFCVFGDGTVCTGWQFREGTCAPANPIGPLSPLAYPKREFPPVRSSSATPLPPLSPEEIVGAASLIFVGSVEQLDQYTDFAVYTEYGRLERNVTDAVGNPLPNIPVTDYLLTVEDVIRDDGAIASEKPVVLRMIGAASLDTKGLTKDTEFPYSYVGDRRLFLLTPNPDGKTYGLRFGPWSRLILDGDALHVSNGVREPFKLAGNDRPATLEEFVRFVEAQPLPEERAAISTPSSTIVDAVGRRIDTLVITPPASLAVLVNAAPLIVIGKVGEVQEYLDYLSYDEVGQLRLNAQPEGRMIPAYPATDFVLEVEEVIRDDGAVGRGWPIILQLAGHITEAGKRLTQTDAYPASFTGDRYLFLLTPNPDGRTYGLVYGPWSRLRLDDDVLRVSDNWQSVLQFPESTELITLDDFIRYVQTGTPPGVNALEDTSSALDVPASPLATPLSFSPTETPIPDMPPIGSGARAPQPPRSLDELVDKAPVIFIGMVGPAVRYIDRCPYTGDAELLTACPAADVDGNPAPTYPLTDFLLDVEVVIRDDATIARHDPILLRLLGRVTDELKYLSPGGEYPFSYTGERYLFLLTPIPDENVYGLAYGPWSRLIIEGDYLRVSDETRQPLQFGQNSAPITLGEFIRFVESR